VTVADELGVENRRTPHSPLRRWRRMRRAHDPSCLRRRGAWRGRDPKQKRGDAGGLRRQCQLAARHEIELARLAPEFQHHRAHRVACERIGRGPHRGFRIACTHRHQQARIETEFGEPAHRQRAGFAFGKILPHPEQRPARGDTPGKASDEPRRRRALPAGLGKHLMHRAAREPALQRRIGLCMAERDTSGPVRAVMRFDARDIAAQTRKHVQACAHLRRRSS
jgi:hypothetical protein